MEGPLRSRWGGSNSPPAKLNVQGKIERSKQGSLIRITVTPGAFVYLIFCWLCAIVGGGIWAILDRSIGAGPLLCMIGFVSLGLACYPLMLCGTRKELLYLLNFLQTSLTS